MNLRESAVRIVVVYPDTLGTYGDGGNATVLAQRLRWRGMPSQLVEVGAGDPVPAGCALYLIGGGEDGPQRGALDQLHAGRGLQRAVEADAVVFGVCAG